MRTRSIPALPHELASPTPVVLVGTALWLVATVWLGIADWGEWGLRFWTCLVGCALGMAGFGVFRWQRSAAQRGSRGSWQGLSGLDD